MLPRKNAWFVGRCVIAVFSRLNSRFSLFRRKDSTLSFISCASKRGPLTPMTQSSAYLTYYIRVPVLITLGIWLRSSSAFLIAFPSPFARSSLNRFSSAVYLGFWITPRRFLDLLYSAFNPSTKTSNSCMYTLLNRGLRTPP